uniref:Remorin-like n=1 Tax=Nicotiana tabacum TaxID=4097 RepID=A0A1S3X188_TOBAC
FFSFSFIFEYCYSEFDFPILLWKSPFLSIYIIDQNGSHTTAIAMAANNSKAVTAMPPPQKTNPSTKNSKGSLDRDTALAQLNNDKKSAFIKAWEESEKSRVDNK